MEPSKTPTTSIPNVQTSIPTAGQAVLNMQAIPSNADPSSKGNKMILWFITGLVITVAIVGGIYFLLSREQNNNTSTKEEVAVQTPLPTPQENLEDDLKAIDIDSNAGDFETVDQDLSQF